jgi:integrase
MTPNKWQGRIFLGRDETGEQRYHYVGRFRTRKERNDVVALAWIDLETQGCDCKGCQAMGRKGPARSTLPTIGAQLDRYLAWYRRRNRRSSLGTQETRLTRFREDFGDRPLDDVKKAELRDWQAGEGAWEGQEKPVPASHMPAVVSFFNWTIDDDDQPVGKNPARGLSERGKGRAEEAPPTEKEFQKLIDSCSVMGKDYAPMMRAIFLFAAFELFRPSELFELKETDIDFRRNRISKSRRLYRGEVDDPKTGPKLTALTAPARDVIAPILPGDGGYVFRNLTDGQLKQNTLTAYWGKVLARADLDFDFYLATKHYGAWFMWTKMGLSNRAIAALAGWSLKTVDAMLETYGHGDVGALDEVDAAFKDRPVTGLRVVEGGKA